MELDGDGLGSRLLSDGMGRNWLLEPQRGPSSRVESDGIGWVRCGCGTTLAFGRGMTELNVAATTWPFGRSKVELGGDRVGSHWLSDGIGRNWMVGRHRDPFSRTE